MLSFPWFSFPALVFCCAFHGRLQICSWTPCIPCGRHYFFWWREIISSLSLDHWICQMHGVLALHKFSPATNCSWHFLESQSIFVPRLLMEDSQHFRISQSLVCETFLGGAEGGFFEYKRISFLTQSPEMYWWSAIYTQINSYPAVTSAM